MKKSELKSLIKKIMVEEGISKDANASTFENDILALCYPDEKEGSDIVVKFILDNTPYNVREPRNITWFMLNELDSDERKELLSLLPAGIVEEATETSESSFADKKTDEVIAAAVKETGGNAKEIDSGFSEDVYKAIRALYTALATNA